MFEPDIHWHYCGRLRAEILCYMHNNFISEVSNSLKNSSEDINSSKCIFFSTTFSNEIFKIILAQIVRENEKIIKTTHTYYTADNKWQISEEPAHSKEANERKIKVDEILIVNISPDVVNNIKVARGSNIMQRLLNPKKVNSIWLDLIKLIKKDRYRIVLISASLKRKYQTIPSVTNKKIESQFNYFYQLISREDLKVWKGEIPHITKEQILAQSILMAPKALDASHKSEKLVIEYINKSENLSTELKILAENFKLVLKGKERMEISRESIQFLRNISVNNKDEYIWKSVCSLIGEVFYNVLSYSDEVKKRLNEEFGQKNSINDQAFYKFMILRENSFYMYSCIHNQKLLIYAFCYFGPRWLMTRRAFSELFG